MTPKPMAAADREFRRRWGLAVDDPGPASLPKALLENDRARKLEAERDATTNVGDQAVSGQGDDDVLTGGSLTDRIAHFQRKPTSERYGFDHAPNPGRTYSYGGRDYGSFAEAKAANPDMVLAKNSPSAAEDRRARRDRAFIRSIGASPFGLGPLAYVLGGGPEDIDLTVQFDNALGGLLEAGAVRGAHTVQLPAANRARWRKKR